MTAGDETRHCRCALSSCVTELLLVSVKKSQATIDKIESGILVFLLGLTEALAVVWKT